MNEATLTFRVDENMKREFANAAKAHGRTGAQLLRDFMRSYVKGQWEVAEYDTWLRENVRWSQDRSSSMTRTLGDKAACLAYASQ